MKMMPGQSPYSPEEVKRLNEKIRDACEAQEEFDLDELEEIDAEDLFWGKADREYQAWKETDNAKIQK